MAENKDEMDHLSDDRQNTPYATPVEYEPDKTLKTDGRSTLAILVFSLIFRRILVIAKNRRLPR